MGEDLKTALDVELDAGAAERIRSGWRASQTAPIGPLLHGQRVVSQYMYNTPTRTRRWVEIARLRHLRLRITCPH